MVRYYTLIGVKRDQIRPCDEIYAAKWVEKGLYTLTRRHGRALSREFTMNTRELQKPTKGHILLSSIWKEVESGENMN